MHTSHIPPLEHFLVWDTVLSAKVDSARLCMVWEMPLLNLLLTLWLKEERPSTFSLARIEGLQHSQLWLTESSSTRAESLTWDSTSHSAQSSQPQIMLKNFRKQLCYGYQILWICALNMESCCSYKCFCSADELLDKEDVIAKLKSVDPIHPEWNYRSAKAMKTWPCLFIVI